MRNKIQVLLLLVAVSLLCGCATARQISETGRKIADAIAQNKDVVFDTVDGAIGVAEAVKTDVKGVFSKSNTVTTATK